jgi:GABA(A) receptor-associated protein
LSKKEIFEKYKDSIDNFIYFFYKLKELNFNFKINNSLKDRIESYKQISKKYPNKIPIICEKYPKCNDIEELNKTKFLIEKTHKIKEFLILLEKNNKLSHPICLIINEKIIDENETLENLYNNYKDEEDNMLYCFYSKKISNSENFNSDSQSNSFEIETNIDSVEPQYKNNFSLIERKNTFKGINEKYPNKIPIICEKHPKSKLNKIEKTRFLINNEMTLNEFKLLIEKYFFDKSEIYIFINDKFIHANLPMKELYNKYKDDDDNFLYCFYSETDDFSTFNNESFDDNKNSDEENNSYEYNEDD